MTQTAQHVSFNPFAPGYTDDPYPHYAQLRRANPVEHHEFGFWALWRHADVAEVLRARLSVEERNVTNHGPMRDLYEQIYGEAGRRGDGMSMLDRDPPDHTRLRKLVSQAFTPRTVERLTPTVRCLVDEALDAVHDAGRVNLIDALAFPLPFTVISVMLGMPDVDHARLRELSHLVVRSLEPVPDEATIRQILAADLELQGIAREAIAWKRRNPADDLLTALINAEDAGDVLSDDELVAQLILIYLAGHETTVNLIGNGARALLEHRDQLELWRERRDLDENAVEELLRHDSPVQFSRRITLEDYALNDDVTIPAGSMVMLALGSANRDASLFGADADDLRLDRDKARQHVSFGAGVHHCLGAALARLEGRVALSTLIRRFPALDLAGPLVWNGRINLRGLSTLDVAVR